MPSQMSNNLAAAVLAGAAASFSPAQEPGRDPNTLNTGTGVTQNYLDSSDVDRQGTLMTGPRAAPLPNWGADASSGAELEKPVVLRASNDPLGAVAPLEVNKNEHPALYNILNNADKSGLNIEYNLRAGMHEFTIEFKGHERTVSTRDDNRRPDVLLKGIQDVSTAAAMPSIDTELAKLNIGQMSREQLIEGVRSLRLTNQRLSDVTSSQEELIGILDQSRNPNRDFQRWLGSANKELSDFEKTLSQPVGIQIDRQLSRAERTIRTQERGLNNSISRLQGTQARIERDWARNDLHIDPLRAVSRSLSDIIDRGILNPNARDAKQRVQEFLGRDFALEAALITEGSMREARSNGVIQSRSGVDGLSGMTREELQRVMTAEAASHFSLKNTLNIQSVELADKGLSNSQLRQIDELSDKGLRLSEAARVNMANHYAANQAAVDRYMELAALSEGLNDAQEALRLYRREATVVQGLSRQLIRNSDRGITGRAAESASRGIRRGADNLGKEVGKTVGDMIEGILGGNRRR
jgi:hypothetical protein